MAAPPLLDPVFHQPVRTRLAALLRQQPHKFSALKAALGITDGNLDAHLRRFSAAGYLHSRMVTTGRPHTLYQLSPSGIAAFDAYAASVTDILAACHPERD